MQPAVMALAKNSHYDFPNYFHHSETRSERHRKGERDLIDMLSRPVSYWLSKRDSSGTSESDVDSIIDSALDFGFVPNETQTSQPPPPPMSAPPLPESSHPLPTPPFFPVASPAVAEAATKINLRIDRKELNNVKLMCAQLLQGHKKLSKQLKTCQEQFKVDDKKSKRSDDSSNTENQEFLLRQWQDQQQLHFRRQLIALDMKERAFLARVRKMEERCMQHTIDQLSSWKHSMDLWKTQREDEWWEWKALLDQPAQTNAHFLGHVTQWVESGGKWTGEASAANNFDDETTQMLFSTDLGEMSEHAPLCNSLSVTSDFMEFSGGTAFVGNDENDHDDELLEVRPSRRRRRRFTICR